MTVKEFFALEPGEIFQQGVFFMDGIKMHYAFKKGHGQDWAGYYQKHDLPLSDVTKFGNKMTWTIAKRLCSKDIVNLYRL